MIHVIRVACFGSTNLAREKVQLKSTTVMRKKPAIETGPQMLFLFLLLLLSLAACPTEAFYHQLPLDGGRAAARPNEYQLTGEAGQQIRLPCLIGKQLFCGEPYFIAWYKLNASSKSWTRFEHKSMEDEELVDGSTESGSPTSSQSLANRVRFDWSPRVAQSKQPVRGANNFKSSICSDPSIFHSTSSQSPTAINNNNNNNNGPRQSAADTAALDQSNFDCAQLTISPLELVDEGQYKCEITFSESLDFDKCPATTLSQLNVIARPNEPELLVNGRKIATSGPGSANLAFREGAQVRLECQSSGGKPAPRIEWLNVSDSSEQLQLMRDFWPQKRSSFLQQDNGQPVTSSSLTVSLSRFDLHSHFVCLVLPQQFRGQQQTAAHYSLEQLVKNPAHLARMLKTSFAPSQQLQTFGQMFKRIKLDVQVRPSSVSLIVRDVYSSSSLLEPVQFQGASESPGQFGTPLYSLQLNRLYAIQCLVEQSRPQSQVGWFNRSVPLAIEALDLSSANGSPYFTVPNELTQSNSMTRPNYNNPPHRISSFVRHELLPDGTTFRTTATLLLTTSIWDNHEEFSCQISNEAFALEELPQAAPVRLFVNYAPFAWLEPDVGRMNQQQQIDWPNGWLAKVSAQTDSQVSLRCSVAANPLLQNTILQIEWLKDGRKIQQQQSQVSSSSSSSDGKQQARQRLHIERANHLHMPTTPSGRANGQADQLAPGSKLIGSSWLTIQSPLNKSTDSGSYTCQFKLIPAPPSTHPNNQAAPAQTTGRSGNEVRITSGQANQTIQVNVVEAKASAPTVGISSTRGVFVYWLADEEQEQQQQNEEAKRKSHQTAVVDSLDTQLSLSCEMSSSNHRQPLGQTGHKILWYANHKLLQSSQQHQARLNTSLRLLAAGGSALITCAHQTLSPTAFEGAELGEFHAASSVRILESTNAIDIRLKVGPRMLERRELLMPQMRSFSELELSANPANKLRLVCLAQCEPLCSIEWYLNQEPLAAVASSKASLELPVANKIHMTPSADQDAFVVQRQELIASRLPWFRLASIENVILPATVDRNESSSRFGWLRHSSLGVTGGQASVQQQLDWLGRQLLREASEQQYLPGQVNVFSRLELSYNSIARLLENVRTGAVSSQAINIKCRVNPTLDTTSFEHLHLQPNQWFRGPTELNVRSSGRTNLTLLFSTSIDSSSSGERRFSFVSEMQTSVILDRAPGGVSIWFAGVTSTDLEPNGITLSESQLIELADPSRVEPLLECKVNPGTPSSQAAMKFKWTFVDWNNTELTLADVGNGQQLNLRRLIELRQSQLNVEPMSALGLDVVLAGIVGNFTCTASNIHGSKSATMPVRLQGRPICKLALANEFLGPENELIANVRCSTYSVPQLIETTWFRSEQQVTSFSGAGNRTRSQSDGGDSLPLVSVIDLPVMVLNKHQEFLLTDLLSGGNFKCMARNSFGYSDACELSQTSKQTLLNTLRPFDNAGGLLSGSSKGGKDPPPLSMVLFPDSKQSVSLLANQTSNNIDIGPTANQSRAGASPMFDRLHNLFRIDWIVIICCLVVGLWLLFILSSARRKFKLSSSQSSGSPRDRNHHTSWRFNSSSRSNSNNEIVGVPFQSSKVCVNYYGGSNNDSEHEMIQSGSQSSHYEDFIQHQLLLKQQQQQLQQQQQQQLQQQQQQRLISQPVYLNGLSTLNRPMKSSLSSSSTCDSSTNSRLGVKKLLTSQTAIRPDHTHLQQQPVASTMRAFMGNSNNVPLVNGSNNSRVNLDHNQTGQYQSRPIRNGLEQQHLYGRGEHIYDDVIYNQMIL